jgi:glyoxylase-like metal-dependent hydrolase (beta-lactamase superfamily II)
MLGREQPDWFDGEASMMTARLAATIKLAVSVCLCLTLWPAAAFARQKPGTSVGSYLRARRALDAGVRALGGLEALRSIEDFSIRESIKQPLVPRPDPPYPTVNATEVTVIATGRKKLFHEENYPLGGYHVWTRTVVNGAEGVSINLRSKEFTPVDDPSLTGFRHLYHKLPHFVLLDALERAPSLRWLGESAFAGRRQLVISAALGGGRQTSFYFDAQSGLLTKYEFLYTDPVHGDSVQEHIFTSYRPLGRLKVPTRRVTRRPGGLVVEAEYSEVQVNSRPADGLFARPEGLTKAQPYSAPPAPVVNRVAEDVYLVQGLFGGEFSVMFVAFDEYVLVVEALESRPFANTSEQVIAKITETVPGKPIKYLVPTHHHYDHAGGARAYIAGGATVVTTPGNRRFFERLAAAPFTLTSDALARRPRPPVIETIEGKKRVLRDSRHVVELYDVGPYAHADEEIIVYLPKEKFLFQGDLYDTGETVAQADTVHLERKIRELGLDVERIAGVHGPVVTLADMRRSIEKRREMSVGETR